MEIPRGCWRVSISAHLIGPKGCNPQQFGCKIIRSSIAALDGTLPLDSPPGKGTRLHAEIPLSRRA